MLLFILMNALTCCFPHAWRLELVKPSLIWGTYRAVLTSNSADYRVIWTLIDGA